MTKSTHIRSSVATTLGLTSLLAASCAGTYPAPTQQMADVESAQRSANELGAQSNPKAQLYLKLADEQLRQAKAAAENDDNLTAERLLTRAKVDAELAVVLTRSGQAKVAANSAVETAQAAHSNNLPEGTTP